MLLGYSTVGSNNLEKAKAFYDALFATIGVEKMFDHPTGGRIYGTPGAAFGVLKPHNGKDACVGNGSMIGFGLESRAQVDAFYAKALALGGADEGAPGERGPGAYFAYFRDLEGNKLCAYIFGGA
ncbi:MAG: VOC family protein [Caulobacteraceae bacterium]|nr:VOC family protein [Caulobacteraceae bacterium]